jgi:dTDP-4-dehydrorhamnose reductase
VPSGVTLLPVDRAALDLTDEGAVRAFVAAQRPDVIINAAAYTAVDRAESEPQAARAVNVTAVQTLASSAAECGARMIHISTDFVFGGAASRPWRPGDATAPESVYGETKRDGELVVRDNLGSAGLVIRTAWLHSAHGSNFVTNMLRLMAERDVLHVIADQVGTPTWAHTLAQTVWAAAATPDVAGTLHWTDAGVASWYDFAVAIQEEALGVGLLQRVVPVHPITTADYPTPARRPAYSVLHTAAMTELLGVVPAHWRVNLRHMLQELRDA